LLKNAIYKTRYKYFRSGIIYVQNWWVCELLKCISRNRKTTNEPTASNNKSERPQVNIWDIWKTLKYLNINENRKDVDRWKFIVLFLLIVVLFAFLNFKSVNIYAMPFIFSTTLLLYKLDTILLIQNNLPVLDITGFFFRIWYSGDGLGATHLGHHPSTHSEKETRYFQYVPLLLFQYYCISYMY
jgi:hypothetical protein